LREEAEALLRDAERFVSKVKSKLRFLKLQTTTGFTGSGEKKARVSEMKCLLGRMRSEDV